MNARGVFINPVVVRQSSDERAQKARREAVHQSVARMQRAKGAAAITILKLTTDTNEKRGVVEGRELYRILQGIRRAHR